MGGSRVTVVPDVLALKSTLAKVACKSRFALDSFVVAVFSSVHFVVSSARHNANVLMTFLPLIWVPSHGVDP
eukprot:1196041-Prorocentrum_minimum.AAC.7